MASPPSLSLHTSRSTSISDSPDHLSTHVAPTTWTAKHEARLQHCQAELAKAQKRWSASQDLWIEEYRSLQTYEKQVDHLLDLKKAHLKALKKQEVQAKKAVGVWKKRTWKPLSRTSSSRNDTPTTITPVDDTDADDEGEEEEDAVDDDALSPIERTDSMPALPTSPTSPPRKSSLSNAVRRLSIAGLRGRRKVSAGNSQAPSGAATPALDGAFELESPVDVEVGRA